MDAILAVLEKAGRYLLTIRITDLLDIAIMAYLVYKLLSLVKSTRAANILKGVAIFLAALWLSSVLELRSVNYLLSHMVSVGVLALMILFQPELRQILEQIGSKNIRLLRVFAPEQQVSEMEQAIDQTVMACTEMSKSRTGVLIVFERKILLNDMVRSGTTLDASVSSELLKNIFFVKAPMHDGAVIIRRGRILGAGCMLPLSKNVQPQPRPRHAPPRGHRHEREFRRGGRDRLGGDGLDLRRHRRHAQATPHVRDALEAPVQRAHARAGGGRKEPPRAAARAAARAQKGGG